MKSRSKQKIIAIWNEFYFWLNGVDIVEWNCTFGERDSIMLLFTHRYPMNVFWHECAKILMTQAMYNDCII